MNRFLAKAHEIAARHRAAKGAAAAAKLFAKTSEERGALYVYEVIGYDYWTGGGVTAKGVADALDALKKDGVKALDMYINSEGGDVFEAKAILANLKRFDGEITVHIDGLAASAATMIAMAGTKIVTAPAATWMVHDAWSYAIGNAADMRSMADLLDLESNALAEVYAARTKKTVAEMRDLMRAETWMSAKEALEKGFTDEISGPAEEDTEEETSASARVAPLIAAAARTQERIRAGAKKSHPTLERHARRVSEITSRASPAKQQRHGQP